MKKFFLFCMIALVAMCGLNSCSDDCNHEFIEVDHSKDIVGIWTCIEPEKDFAQAWVIKADGTLEITSVANGEFFESKGTIQLKNNKMTYKLENGEEFEGRFELIEGESFSLVSSSDPNFHYIYRYCEEDLADDIVGMWVVEKVIGEPNDWVQVVNYHENGKATLTTYMADVEGYVKEEEYDYKVVGNLQVNSLKGGPDQPTKYVAVEFTIYANFLGEDMNDIMLTDNPIFEEGTSFTRIKQGLDLAGKKYDYDYLYLSDVKGQDKDIDIMGFTLNFASMDGSKLDMMLRTTNFHVEFPNANTIKYSYQYGENKDVVELPIVVEGNKMIFKMSERGSALKDVTFYAFQDMPASQMHLYMHRDAVVDFYTNMQAFLDTWTKDEDIINDAEAVKAIYDSFDQAIESINLSIILR